MATQGAVQIDIVINNQTITTQKEHAVSLSVIRVIGDSADEFTLEAFDETAWKLENALMENKLASITIKYSVASDLSKTILFSGSCLGYQISFAGKAVMITIKGILSASEDNSVNYWFDRRAIEWVGGYDIESGIVDGKSKSDWSQYADNEDICAIMDYPLDADGNPSSTPTIYYNPSRIFKRIIHKYNGDRLGSNSSTAITISTSTQGVPETAWNYYRMAGFSEAATAGIMGNIQQESSFSPSRLQNGKGPAAGLFQWENYTTKTSRWASLNNFAKSKGKDWTNTEVQLEFALSEMSSAFRIYSPRNWGRLVTLDEYKTWTNIDDCTEIFEKVFERAGTPMMENRKRYAHEFYNQFHGHMAIGDNSEITLSQDTPIYEIKPGVSGPVMTLPRGTTVTLTSYNGSTISSNKSLYYISYNGTTYALKASSIEGSYYTKIESGTTTSGPVEGWGTGGNNGFILGDVEKSRWIQGLVTTQNSNQTAAQYINDVLCKAAMTCKYDDIENEIAGFKYYVKDGKHHFQPLNYAEEVDSSNVITIKYGVEDSTVISFTLSDIGTIAMLGCNATDDSIADSTSMDIISGDIIRADNLLGVRPDTENVAFENWSNANLTNVSIRSSSSPTELKSVLSDTWNSLQSLTYTAELTLWGDFSNKYTPGKYVDIIVMGNGKKHYSSGIYYVIQIQDNISSDGYTQTLKLIKNTAKSKDYTSISESYSDPDLHDKDGKIISLSTIPTSSTATNSAIAGAGAMQSAYNNSFGRSPLGGGLGGGFR